MTPTVLCIGGLDPSGGAGLAADLKTATSLSAYGMSVLTALTVQHPGGVDRIAPIPPDIVAEQLSCLLDAMPVGAIKIGMIANTDVAAVLLKLLTSIEVPIVLDPVQVATSGATLSTIDDDIFDQLLSMAQVITPNSQELARCVGEVEPGRWAINRGTAVLHTGGHSNSDPIADTIWLPSGLHRRWTHPRVSTPHTHGSGCTLSTALAVGLARGLELTEAAGMAVQFTAKLIEASAPQNLVPDNGPLLHFRVDE